MNLAQRIIGRFTGSARSLENPSTSLANPAQWLIDWAGGRPSRTGLRVNEETAAQLTAVFGCVRVLSSLLGMLPINLIERVSERSKRVASEHPAHVLVHREPNQEQTPYFFTQTLQAQSLLWGRGYAALDRGRGGRVEQMLGLLPGKTRAERRGGQLWYVTEFDNASPMRLRPDEVLHIPGLSLNGLDGLSPVGMAREAFGLSMAAEQFGAAFFGSGAQLGGVLEHPGGLGDTAAQNLRESWENMHRGLDNAHKVAILEEGMQYKRIGIPPEDAQFLETRQFQIPEICRLFGVPPHLIADLTRATFSNIEQQDLDVVRHTLQPWVTRWEQELNRKLLRDGERARYFFKFNLAALLRGDTAARSAYYREMFGIGAMSPNDIRDLEDMNAIPDGDQYFVPLNMVPIDSVAGPADDGDGDGDDDPGGDDDGDPDGDDDGDPDGDDADRAFFEERRRAAQVRSMGERQQLQARHVALFEQSAQHVVEREVARVGRAAGSSLGSGDVPGFLVFLDQYYEQIRDLVVERFQAAVRVLGEGIHAVAAAEIGAAAELTPEMEQFLRDYVGALAARYVASSKGQLRQIVRDTDDDGRLDAIRKRLEDWQEKRAKRVALREVVQVGAAAAKQTWRQSGVQQLRWVTVGGETCPMCRALDGKIVGVQQNFVEAGEQVGDDVTHITPRRAVGHPPLHEGCDCQIVAERG